MRLSVAPDLDFGALESLAVSDPAAPDLTFLVREFESALRSFFATVERISADNPVPLERLAELQRSAQTRRLTDHETEELERIKQMAARRGRAVAAVIGFFLKYKPHPMLDEVRGRSPVFQPPIGPVLVAGGDAVREVFERNHDFTVEPYGVEMKKVMTPGRNGGFGSFILGTDEDAVYEPDKTLLTAVCTRADAQRITSLVHEDCMRRVGAAVEAARASGSLVIDVVTAVARYVPVTVGARYLGVPVASGKGTFTLDADALAYYGEPIDGQPQTALTEADGIVPDEPEMYRWIKSAFQHFFNNVQKDPQVQAEGFRCCRQLLAYLLREISIQRQRMLAAAPVEDTMLSRLVRFQLGLPAPVPPPPGLDPRRVSDLRIAENVMGAIVGAIAGQEEATCRVVDSLLRLRDGEYRTAGAGRYRYGSFDEARELALNVLNGIDADKSRGVLHQYFFEALRLQPQGEVLVRKCARDGSRIGESRPIAAGTFIFASHASAMRDVPEPDAFVLGRPPEHYLRHGWRRHTCLGQHVSPVIAVESLIALLALDGLGRPPARAGEPSFPLERRFGRLQLDDQNLYATNFALQFADSGTTRQFYPASN